LEGEGCLEEEPSLGASLFDFFFPTVDLVFLVLFLHFQLVSTDY